MRTADTVERLVQAAIAALGYELADVEFQKEQGNWVLTLYIDRPGGVTLDDCETVSRAVEPILDEADPIEQHYYLSVSSLGIDRPLKKDRDFERNLGKPLEVRLYAPVEKQKEFTGTLTRYDADTFAIACAQGEERVFSRKSVALVRPHITF